MVLLKSYDGVPGLVTEDAIHCHVGAVVGVQLGLQLSRTTAGISLREHGAVVQVHRRRRRHMSSQSRTCGCMARSHASDGRTRDDQPSCHGYGENTKLLS